MQPASNNTERATIIFMVVLLGCEQSEAARICLPEQCKFLRLSQYRS
jgi:hypothetical protein